MSVDISPIDPPDEKKSSIVDRIVGFKISHSTLSDLVIVRKSLPIKTPFTLSKVNKAFTNSFFSWLFFNIIELPLE